MGIVFISESAKEIVLNKYVLQKDKQSVMEKSFVIPNGIDPFWMNNPPTEDRNLQGNNLSLIYYGDIDRNKNIGTSINAAKRLIDEGYGVKFLVAGKIKDKYNKELIENASFVEYLGFKPKEELIDYLRQADIFVMPSFSETSGLAYAEAMSQGVPIIYTKAQGFDGQFPEGEVGFHVNPKSAEDVKERICDIIADYPAISNRCIDRAKQYNWDAIVSQYEDLYSAVVSLEDQMA